MASAQKRLSHVSEFNQLLDSLEVLQGAILIYDAQKEAYDTND